MTSFDPMVCAYRVRGALGAATNYARRHVTRPDWELLGQLLLSQARVAGLVELQDPDWPAPGRWQCRRCGGRHVQVTLPYWYREVIPPDTDEYRAGCLEPVGVDEDEDADPLWWLCEDCEQSGEGAPIDCLTLEDDTHA